MLKGRQQIACEFKDKKTLLRQLDAGAKNGKYIEGWPDGKNRQKIEAADYSMYV